MKTEDRYAKLLALSIIYEKDKQQRTPFVQRISCNPKDIPILLKDVQDQQFKTWIESVAHLFK